ncbi:hypothetical protein ATANTOWER_001067 [Ataeniobius toweri]|uniref:NADH dehydrogenase subunit 1 n=1 Tax=Ataeniobius toweri TaxID=208326 RepID=A0ABU7ACG1_9TELE|nr:hypothetical protein [Ataeniobius toweri]
MRVGTCDCESVTVFLSGWVLGCPLSQIILGPPLNGGPKVCGSMGVLRAVVLLAVLLGLPCSGGLWLSVAPIYVSASGPRGQVCGFLTPAIKYSYGEPFLLLLLYMRLLFVPVVFLSLFVQV